MGTNNFECIDILNLIFANEMPAFYIMNAFTYIWRAGKKLNDDGELDYAKAKFYIEKYHDLQSINSVGGRSENSGLFASRAPSLGAYGEVADLIDSILKKHYLSKGEKQEDE
jgi:hypothetical protein